MIFKTKMQKGARLKQSETKFYHCTRSFIYSSQLSTCGRKNSKALSKVIKHSKRVPLVFIMLENKQCNCSAKLLNLRGFKKTDSTPGSRFQH